VVVTNSRRTLEMGGRAGAELRAQQLRACHCSPSTLPVLFHFSLGTGLMFISVVSSEGKDWRNHSNSCVQRRCVQGKRKAVALVKVQTRPEVAGSALQDLPASLMGSAALAVCSCAIYLKDETGYVRKIAGFL